MQVLVQSEGSYQETNVRWKPQLLSTITCLKQGKHQMISVYALYLCWNKSTEHLYDIIQILILTRGDNVFFV